MPTRSQSDARQRAAASPSVHHPRSHGPGSGHKLPERKRGLTTGRRFGVGRVISPAHYCGSLVHSTIGIAGAALVNAPETGRSSHNWLVGNRALALFTPHRAASTGARSMHGERAVAVPGANPVASSSRVTSSAAAQQTDQVDLSRAGCESPVIHHKSKCVLAFAPEPAHREWPRSYVAVARGQVSSCIAAAGSPHSAPGETAGAPHSGDCRRGRQRLSHCGVRGLASPASVRPGDLRGVAGALSNTDGDPRAKRVNRPAGSFDRARDTLLFPRMAGVAVTFYSEANQ